MNKKRELIILIFLMIILLAVNYNSIDKALEKFFTETEVAKVERVIDGDTIEIENKTSVRLLGINTPEKGEKYYNEAKDFLEMVLLNKTIELKFGKDRYDKYKRLLAYVFVDGKNVNKELVDEGYANFYFPSGKDRYYLSFVKAWEHCLKNNKFLCESSEEQCSDCIELIDLDCKEQEVILGNNCSFDCSLKNWTMKHEGRKKFNFGDFTLKAGEEVKIIVGQGNNTEEKLFWLETKVFTETGDSLFLRDEENKLVLWENY